MATQPTEEWSPARVFAAIDVDNSGSIDLSELGVALTAVLGKEVKEKEVVEVMNKFDEDKDGMLSLLEFTSFVSAMAAKKSSYSIMSFRAPSTKSADRASHSRSAVIALENRAANGPCIGIHIGTSNTRTSSFNVLSNTPTLLSSKLLTDNKTSVPSVVYLAQEGSTCVGTAALTRAIAQKSAWNCVPTIKRTVGEDYSYPTFVNKLNALHVPAEVVRSKSDFVNNATESLDYASYTIPDFKICGAQFPPEELTSLLVRHASRVCDESEYAAVESGVDTTTRAVITVPSHWPGHKRKSYRISARTAGYDNATKYIPTTDLDDAKRAELNKDGYKLDTTAPSKPTLAGFATTAFTRPGFTRLLNTTTACLLSYFFESAFADKGKGSFLVKELEKAQKKELGVPFLTVYVGGGFFDFAYTVAKYDQRKGDGKKGDGKLGKPLLFDTQAVKGGEVGGEDFTSALVEYVCLRLKRVKPTGEESSAAAASGLNLPKTNIMMVDQILYDAQNYLNGFMASREKAASVFEEGAGATATTTTNFRGVKPSTISNNVGLYVAEAMKVREAVERAKKRVSDPAVKTVTIEVDGFEPVTLSKEEMTEVNEANYAKITSSLSAFLAEVKPSPSAQILLAGGATLDPNLKSRLFSLLPRVPLQPTTPPDAMAAAGAAIHGAKISNYLPPSTVSNYAIQEVLPYAISVSDSWNQSKGDHNKSKPVFPKFAKYGSYSRNLNFYTTSDTQTQLNIYLKEEGMPVSTATLDIHNIPALHEGSDINVICKVDEDGLFQSEATFVDISFSMKLQTKTSYLRSFHETMFVKKRLDTQTSLNTMFYERDACVKALKGYCEQTREIMESGKLVGKIREIDRLHILETVEQGLHWLSTDGNLSSKKKVSLELKRVEGYKMLYVQKLRECKEVCAPIIDSIVNIAAKTSLDKDDFCIATPSDGKHGADLAVVVDKIHVVFFDDLKDRVVKCSQIEHAFPADVEKARVRYQAAADELGGLKSSGGSLEEVVGVAFRAVVDKYYPKEVEDVATEVAEEGEEGAKEEPKEEPKEEQKEEQKEEIKEEVKEEEKDHYATTEIEFGPCSPLTTAMLFDGLLNNMKGLDEEQKTKQFLKDKMLVIMKEADADNSGTLSVAEVNAVVLALANESLEIIHARMQKIRSAGPLSVNDFVMAVLLDGKDKAEQLCRYVDERVVIVFGDAADIKRRYVDLRRANGLDYERCAEKYEGYKVQLEKLRAMNAKEMYSSAVFRVMNAMGEKKDVFSKTVKYEGGAKEGKMFIEELLGHFEFFVNETFKLEALRSQWGAACKEADKDGSGDIDESEGIAVWKGLIDDCTKRTQNQLHKLKKWRDLEAKPGDAGGVSKVLKV